MKDTLYGEDFPPEDVEAYWSIVPGSFVVTWYPGLGCFELEMLMDSGYVAYNAEERLRCKISAEAALRLDTWMEAVSRLSSLVQAA